MWSRRQALMAGAAVLGRPAIATAAPVRMRIGHGLPTGHPVHGVVQSFADTVRERTSGALEMEIFPDGQIGQEVDLITQAQLGKIDFIRVSASVLERVAPAFRVFNLPFVFRDHAHWAAVTSNRVGADILDSARTAALVGLTYYDAGSRSFYGQKPIDHPDDLKGLKIRVQPSPTMMQLMRLLGAEGIELPWEQVFPALKNRLVDGAENSVASLLVGRHGEVVSHYSFDEHTMVPDVFLVSLARWQTFTPAQQAIIREAAAASHQRMNEAWAAFEAKARGAVETMGVRFTKPDKLPFVEKAAPLGRMFADDRALIELKRRIEQS